MEHSCAGGKPTKIEANSGILQSECLIGKSPWTLIFVCFSQFSPVLSKLRNSGLGNAKPHCAQRKAVYLFDESHWNTSESFVFHCVLLYVLCLLLLKVNTLVVHVYF